MNGVLPPVVEERSKTSPDRSNRRWLGGHPHAAIVVALVVLALARGLLYAAVTPPWQAPDEPKHFEYARLIADEGRLVNEKDRSVPMQTAIIESMVRHRFWELGYYTFPYDAANPPQELKQVWAPVQASMLFHPPLYYALCAMATWPWLSADVTTQLYAMRVLSVLLFAGIVVTAFLTGRELFPADTALLIAIPAAVLWQPMFTFISSSVNNDNLANLLVAVLIWLLVRWYVRGFSVLHGLAVVALLLLGLLTKRTTLFAWPLVAVAVPLYLWGRGAGRWARWAWIAGAGVVIAGLLGLVALALSGQGGPLFKWLAIDLYWGTDVLRNPDEYRLTDPTVYAAYAEHLFVTFWASFGWTARNLERAWYWVLVAIHLVTAGGLILWVARAWRGRISLSRGQKRALLLLIVAIVLSLGIVLGKEVRLQTFLPGDLPQGRYLFPVIVPIFVLLIVGLWQWSPARYRRLALVVFLSALALFDALCLVGYVVPFFYLT